MPSSINCRTLVLTMLSLLFVHSSYIFVFIVHSVYTPSYLISNERPSWDPINENGYWATRRKKNVMTVRNFTSSWDKNTERKKALKTSSHSLPFHKYLHFSNIFIRISQFSQRFKISFHSKIKIITKFQMLQFFQVYQIFTHLFYILHSHSHFFWYRENRRWQQINKRKAMGQKKTCRANVQF